MHRSEIFAILAKTLISTSHRARVTMERLDGYRPEGIPLDALPGECALIFTLIREAVRGSPCDTIDLIHDAMHLARITCSQNPGAINMVARDFVARDPEVAVAIIDRLQHINARLVQENAHVGMFARVFISFALAARTHTTSSDQDIIALNATQLMFPYADYICDPINAHRRAAFNAITGGLAIFPAIIDAGVFLENLRVLGDNKPSLYSRIQRATEDINMRD